MMGITHVLRGEDLLSSTPRQIPLYRALEGIGVGTGAPRFGHLPMVMGEGNKRLSKRDPAPGSAEYVDRGFLPEGMLNYLALLGWGIAEDRDVFTMEEMAEAFDVRRVNPNPARFDMKKLRGDQQRAHAPDRLAGHDRAGHPVPRGGRQLVDDPITEEQRACSTPRCRWCTSGSTRCRSPSMLGFLFVNEDDFTRDPADVEKVLDDAGLEVVQASYDALSALSESDWTTAAIEEALRAKLVEELGLKPRNAFGPVRVAVTGRRISPPLFESLELLGRDISLARHISALP